VQRGGPASKQPGWVRQALHLALWITPALLLPLVLGLAVDSLAGTAPWGTLFGVVAGSSFALIIVLYQVKALYGTTAPPDDFKHS